MEASAAKTDLFTEVVQLIKDHLNENVTLTGPVIKFRSPAELCALIDFSLPDGPEPLEKLVEYAKLVLEYSVHTSHPRFFNQLYAGSNEIGIVSQMISSTTNTSVATFEIAPVYTTIEKIVLEKMCEMIGYPESDGIFSPGGSISNLYGLLCARHKQNPNMRTTGMFSSKPLVIFTSKQAHYSVKKSAIIMGIGTDNVVTIDCDFRGKMLPNKLEEAIEAVKDSGKCPLAVVATAGTTVTGVFDPFTEIAEICGKHKIWMHIDAALGGSAIMSSKYKCLLKGVERSDSLTWNAHKALVIPQQCSAFLTKHKGVLAQCNSTHASYLFQQDKQSYDVSLDTGDKSIQCARLNDAFKLWLMWKAKGKLGFEKQIDKIIDLAKYLAEEIKKREGFELVMEPEYSNCCFWYYPPCLRGKSTPDPVKLSKVAPIIKDRMVKAGNVMVTYMPLGNLPNFFRMVTISSLATKNDMDFVLDEIDRLGCDISV